MVTYTKILQHLVTVCLRGIMLALRAFWVWLPLWLACALRTKPVTYLCKFEPPPFPHRLDSGQQTLSTKFSKTLIYLNRLLLCGLAFVHVGLHPDKWSPPTPSTNPGIIHARRACLVGVEQAQVYSIYYTVL